MAYLPTILVALIVATVAPDAESFSTFVGMGAPAHQTSRTVSTTVPRRGLMEMRAVAKRGKTRAPPRLRHDYSHVVNERDMKSDTFEPHKTGTDGMPAFNLFVKGHRKHDWLPCGSLISDEATADLVKSYLSTDSLDVKDEVDEIVARSLAGAWEAVTHLDAAIFSVYPHLRKNEGELEYGYKIAYENLSAKQGKMASITQKIMRP